MTDDGKDKQNEKGSKRKEPEDNEEEWNKVERKKYNLRPFLLQLRLNGCTWYVYLTTTNAGLASFLSTDSSS